MYSCGRDLLAYKEGNCNSFALLYASIFSYQLIGEHFDGFRIKPAQSIV